jgi:hypothetical protein
MFIISQARKAAMFLRDIVIPSFALWLEDMEVAAEKGTDGCDADEEVTRDREEEKWKKEMTPKEKFDVKKGEQTEQKNKEGNSQDKWASSRLSSSTEEHNLPSLNIILSFYTRLRLIESLHREGINLRHLGHVRKNVRTPLVRYVLLHEIVCRTLKNEIRRAFRDDIPNMSAPYLEPYKVFFLFFFFLFFSSFFFFFLLFSSFFFFKITLSFSLTPSLSLSLSHPLTQHTTTHNNNTTTQQQSIVVRHFNRILCKTPDAHDYWVYITSQMASTYPSAITVEEEKEPLFR